MWRVKQYSEKLGAWLRNFLVGQITFRTTGRPSITQEEFDAIMRELFFGPTSEAEAEAEQVPSPPPPGRFNV